MPSSVNNIATTTINNINKTNTTPVQKQDSNVNFADFIKNDFQKFLNTAQATEIKMNEFVKGAGNIEELAPQLKALMLEFEAKQKIAISIANIIKNLTSINI